MKYRVITRVISFIDMIIPATILGAFALLYEIGQLKAANEARKLRSGLATNESNSATATNETNSATYGNYWTTARAVLTLLFILTIFVTYYLVQIFAGWKLMKGTVQSVLPMDGLRHCQSWRSITIFVTVITLIMVASTFLMESSEECTLGIITTFNLLLCIYHIVSLVFVQKYYTKELASHLTCDCGGIASAQCYTKM